MDQHNIVITTQHLTNSIIQQLFSGLLHHSMSKQHKGERHLLLTHFHLF